MEIACVTGGTGVVGNELVSLLQKKQLHVRVLSRNSQAYDNTEIFCGDLSNKEILSSFLNSASYLFNCAGEKTDESLMHEVNVKGVRNIVEVANDNNLKFFCHLSSAGVIDTQDEIVTEDSNINGLNIYEKTKIESEKIIIDNFNSNYVILRPTNIISNEDRSLLSFFGQSKIKNQLKYLFSGNEKLHLIDSRDVALACINNMHDEKIKEIFLVSNDEEIILKDVYEILLNKKMMFQPLPITFIKLLRWIKKGKKHNNQITFDNRKIESYGWKPKFPPRNNLKNYFSLS